MTCQGFWVVVQDESMVHFMLQLDNLLNIGVNVAVLLIPLDNLLFRTGESCLDQML